MSFTIAIDGPVGAGKSSVADAVAAKLGIPHLDTGAMYRAVGLTAIRQQIDRKNEAAVTAMCDAVAMRIAYDGDRQMTLVNNEDVSGLIRTPEVSQAASDVGVMAGVRRRMVAIQQQIAREHDLLMDGRDIGTVVLKDASLKIYLTASAEERATRRWKEMQAKGMTDSFEQVLADLRRRDDQDMNRAVDPLRPAEDAIILDSTGMTFDEVVETIVTMARERMTVV